jgi:hypothetical protein
MAYKDPITRFPIGTEVVVISVPASCKQAGYCGPKGCLGKMGVVEIQQSLGVPKIHWLDDKKSSWCSGLTDENISSKNKKELL